jgi:hypothetical protein
VAAATHCSSHSVAASVDQLTCCKLASVLACVFISVGAELAFDSFVCTVLHSCVMVVYKFSLVAPVNVGDRLCKGIGKTKLFDSEIVISFHIEFVY